jgi:protein-S-isoprenylcysteine O-methyltransferase Ste14
MSLLRIPFSLSVIWAVHRINTAPQPPPRPSERIGPIGREVYWLPPAIKVHPPFTMTSSTKTLTYLSAQACFYLVGLAEISTILAAHYPENTLSKLTLSALGHASPADSIQLTWPFLLAWLCCITGACIRQRCYQLLGESFTFEISLRRNHTLITSGPYAFVRHPSYSSGALGMFGALACHTTSGSWLRQCSGALHSAWAGPLISLGWAVGVAIFAVAIVPRLEKEDRLMQGRFGAQWDCWATDVPYKLVPWVF